MDRFVPISWALHHPLKTNSQRAHPSTLLSATNPTRACLVLHFVGDWLKKKPSRTQPLEVPQLRDESKPPQVALCVPFSEGPDSLWRNKDDWRCEVGTALGLIIVWRLRAILQTHETTSRVALSPS